MNDIYKGALNNLDSFIQQLRSLALSDPDKAVKLYSKHGKKLDQSMRKVLSELAIDVGAAYASTTARKENPEAEELFSLTRRASPENIYVEEDNYYQQPVTTGRPPPDFRPRRTTDASGEPSYGVTASQELLPPSDFSDNEYAPMQRETVMSGPIGMNEDGGEIMGMLDPNSIVDMGTSPETPDRPYRNIPTDENGNVIQYP